MTENKKGLAKTFLNKVLSKNNVSNNEATEAVALTAEAGFDKGKKVASQEILNPNNVAVKKNRFKQGVVQTLSQGPSPLGGQ